MFYLLMHLVAKYYGKKKMKFASNFFPSPSTNFLLKKDCVFLFGKICFKKHHPEKNILISPKNIMLLPPVISSIKKKKKEAVKRSKK